MRWAEGEKRIFKASWGEGAGPALEGGFWNSVRILFFFLPTGKLSLIWYTFFFWQYILITFPFKTF